MNILQKLLINWCLISNYIFSNYNHHVPHMFQLRKIIGTYKIYIYIKIVPMKTISNNVINSLIGQ